MFIAIEQGMASQKPMAFFLERYADAYPHELDVFVTGLKTGVENYPVEDDGRKALLIANAACESIATGKVVNLSLEKG